MSLKRQQHPLKCHLLFLVSGFVPRKMHINTATGELGIQIAEEQEIVCSCQNVNRSRGNSERFHMVELIFQPSASRRFGKMLGFSNQDGLWSRIFEHLFPGPLQSGGITN